MKSIGQKLRVMFPGIKLDPLDGEVTVVKDRNGERIEFWGRPEPEPTQQDFDAVTDQNVDDEIADNESDFQTRFDPLLKAFALVMLDEINVLRTQAGLPARTVQQLQAAVKAKI